MNGRNDPPPGWSHKPIEPRKLSRRELCERIAAKAMKAAEYESGSVHATRIALNKARDIRRDAELLESSLLIRLAAIDLEPVAQPPERTSQ